ncbi:Homeodomain-interacting protein kinase 2 [Collichthys lucidus]|uniref:Homeodomain-interacting protein kinase 2 n=1 Tax=Collichthys lucidus TaxID=240159 RepID=A0A4U5VI87_COLLU|nr:Homeodomain-interacting protein kinase 2 [Collichthys lucidus]
MNQFSINTNTASDLQISHGTTLGQFHKVESILGEGGFGFVTRCLNLKTNRQEAIKIFKNSRNTVQNAKLEICILKRLRCLDPDTCNIVRWNGFFFDQDRICLNFDLMDLSLYTFLKERNFEGLTTPELRPVIAQLATALSHLRSIGLVHADLKPDNVMIVDRYQTPLQVRLIDFGLAHPVAAVKPGKCVQTTWYRAPEVTLHLPFNDAIDMWSLGITAAELSTGYPLYPGNTDYDVLRFIFQTQGQPSDNVLDRGLGTGCYFDKDQTNGHWTFKSPEDFAEQTGIYAVDTREYRLENLDALVHVMEEEIEVTHQGLLADLIKRMLHLDPDLRIKPLEVLRHPFFDITSSSSADPVTTMDDGPADLAVSIENTEEAKNNENMLEDQLVDNDGPVAPPLPLLEQSLSEEELPSDGDLFVLRHEAPPLRPPRVDPVQLVSDLPVAPAAPVELPSARLAVPSVAPLNASDVPLLTNHNSRLRYIGMQCPSWWPLGSLALGHAHFRPPRFRCRRRRCRRPDTTRLALLT